MDERATATWSTTASSPPSRAAWLARARPTLLFLAACVFLSAVENVRYPTGVPALYFALPSVDLAVLLVVYALLGRYGRGVPRWAHVALVTTFVVVRFFRSGDGVTVRFLRRPFHLHLDSVLIPELARLLERTVAPALVVIGALLLPLAFVSIGYGVHRALRQIEHYLKEPRHARGVGIALAFATVLSFAIAPRLRKQPLYTGAFAVSGVARLAEEATILARLPKTRREIQGRIQATRGVLESVPDDLGKLAGSDVFLFFVESYGETTFRDPAKAARIVPVYREFERELGARGFQIASSLLESPTAGGGSWLAHATFSTGVKVTEQLSYELLTLAHPHALSDFFENAGYRTVLVQPGTTRPNPQSEFLYFDQRYYAKAFDYRGPDVGWGRYPDQYVIDFVHRREPRRGEPRFFAYVLVTSHAPFSAEPPLLEDWSQIGDGSSLGRRGIIQHPTGWTDYEAMARAYTSTVVYDLEVLRRYIAEFVTDDALVILLGDHQPISDITEDRNRRGVPIHVLSRHREHVEAFKKRGYDPGMLPGRQPPYPGMEDFLRTFLEDFSNARRRVNGAKKG